MHRKAMYGRKLDTLEAETEEAKIIVKVNG